MSKNNVCLSIFFWCAKENARKRKAHEPFPLDTRPLCRNTNLLSLKKQLGTCARKLAFAQTVRACADGFAARPLAMTDLPFSLRQSL